VKNKVDKDSPRSTEPHHNPQPTTEGQSDILMDTNGTSSSKKRKRDSDNSVSAKEPENSREKILKTAPIHPGEEQLNNVESESPDISMISRPVTTEQILDNDQQILGQNMNIVETLREIVRAQTSEILKNFQKMQVQLEEKLRNEMKQNVQDFFAEEVEKLVDSKIQDTVDKMWDQNTEFKDDIKDELAKVKTDITKNLNEMKTKISKIFHEASKELH